MKIALFHNLPFGGAKRHTFEQVRELARRGHDLVEFTLSTADLSYCSIAPYVREQKVYRYDPVRQFERRVPLVTPYLHAWEGIETLRRMDRLSRRIAMEIDEGGFDGVLVKDCRIAMNPYVLRYLSTPSAFQCHHGLRHWLTVPVADRRGGLTRLKDLYYRPARRLFESKFHSDEILNARSASLVLTNSEFSRQLIADHYGVDAHAIYPGINVDTFRPLALERLDYVLSVGALVHEKGYRFLVSALARMNPARRPTLFIAANSSEAAEERIVRDLAERTGVKLQIERIVDDARLVQVYNQARAFVYAPYQEALGMAALESLACGTPVVAVAEGGVRETIVNGETGWLTQRDARAFAERLECLLGDEAARARMSQAGIARVRQDWSWSHAVDRLEKNLGELRPVRAGR